MTKCYLGDGVFAALEPCGVVLTTENGLRVTNTIVLEAGVYEALVVWMARAEAVAIDAPLDADTRILLTVLEQHVEDGTALHATIAELEAENADLRARLLRVSAQAKD
jgi:hypothetical protein